MATIIWFAMSITAEKLNLWAGSSTLQSYLLVSLLGSEKLPMDFGNFSSAFMLWVP
jgi:hypothetical protein